MMKKNKETRLHTVCSTYSPKKRKTHRVFIINLLSAKSLWVKLCPNAWQNLCTIWVKGRFLGEGQIPGKGRILGQCQILGQGQFFLSRSKTVSRSNFGSNVGQGRI